MEKFIYEDIDRQIVIVLSNGHCFKPSTVNSEYFDAIFVHQISPLTVSIVCAHDSLNSVELSDFEHLSVNGQNISVRRSLADLDYWQYVLERLPSIISKYHAASRFEKNNPTESFYSGMVDYLNRAVDYMEGEGNYPLRCPHCNVKLEISCGFYNGFDFGDNSIQGYRFFECDQCKEPVDKKAILKSAITVLQNWSLVIESQLECYCDKRQYGSVSDQVSEESSERVYGSESGDGNSDVDSRASKKIRLNRAKKRTRASSARDYNLRSRR